MLRRKTPLLLLSLCFFALGNESSEEPSPTSSANPQIPLSPPNKEGEFLPEWEQALTQNREVSGKPKLPWGENTAGGIRTVPVRLLGSGTTYGSDILNVYYSSEVQLGESTTVTVVTESSFSGEVFMHISNTCKKGSGLQCIRTSTGDNNHAESLITAIVVDLSGSGNMFTGSYTLTASVEGFVTISVYTRKFALTKECYEDIYHGGAPLEVETVSTVEGEWGSGVVCCGLEDYVSIRWRGQICIPTGKTFEFQLRADYKADVYVNGNNVISDNAKGPVNNTVTLSTGCFEFVVDYAERVENAHIRLLWNYPTGSGSSNFEKIHTSYFSNISSMFISKNVKATCKKGYFINTSGVCQLCPKGEYNDEIGKNECKKCPEGTYGDIEGAIEKSECKECEKGTFNNVTGVTACEICPVGTYGQFTKMLECTKCPVGTYGVEEEAIAESQCKDCEVGTYNDVPGATKCKDCLKGTFADVPRLEECIDCSKGTFANETKTVTCSNCSKGTYADETGLDKCKDCPEGTYGDTITATDKLQCTACPLGTYNNVPAATECKDCLEGSYSDETGLVDCKLCYPGTYNDLVKATSCKACPKGTYGEGYEFTSVSDCALCPKGTYNPVIAQASATACLQCPAMTYSDSYGASKCRDCPIRTYTNTEGATGCFPCHPLCLECSGPSNAACRSCTEGVNAVFALPETCECPEDHFYDEAGERCVPCHVFCVGCFGETSDECYECNTAISSYVVDKPNSCVYECEDGYYKDSTVCKRTFLHHV